MAIRARLLDLGRRYYTPVLALQRALQAAVAEGREPDTWQVVVYPIRRLERFREVVPLVASLETAVTGALYRFGIDAQPRSEHRGVYVGDDAICAIGIAVKRMTSLHGLALNACTVLDYDRLITPCGTPQFGITSISAQTGREVSWAEARDALLDSLEGAFGIEFEREEIPPGAPLPFPSNPVVETA